MKNLIATTFAKAALLLCCQLIALVLTAQNLVVNPSFENTVSNCSNPAGESLTTDLLDWDIAVNDADSCSTPDLYSACNPFVTNVPNAFLGFQNARTGSRFVGIITHELFSEWREYVQGHTSSPLVAGQQYCVSMYVSLPENVQYATDNIGVYFSNTHFGRDACPGVTNSRINVTPHLNYDCGAITDTSEWVRLEWTYTATGGETYFIIGNFFSAANTTVVNHNTAAFNPYGYYYIDDVSIVANSCCHADIQQMQPLCIDVPAFDLSATGGTGSSCVSALTGTWSGPGITDALAGTFDPALAGVGTHTVNFTLGCGYVASRSIVVERCATLEACIQSKGQFTVSNGVGPYIWEQGVDTVDCSGCPLGVCFPLICPGTTTTVWTQFATGTTVTVPGTFPIRVRDAAGNELVVNSASELSACSVTCPTITITVDAQVNVSCSGSADGSATVSASGGTDPYSFTWQPGNRVGATQTGLTAGVYTVRAIDNGKCEGTTTVTITEPTALTATTSQTNAGCAGNDGTATVTPGGGTPPYSYLWSANGDTTQTATGLGAGTYAVTITDENNCSLVAAFLITALSDTSSTQDVSICDGESFLAGGDFQTASGTYFDTLVAANGCDSIVITNLTVLPVATANVDVSICDGDSFFAGGAFQNVSGTYYDTLVAANGCDSIVATSLTVLPDVITDVDVSICDGENYFAGGAFQTVSGTYYDTLTAASGCDSVVATNLTVVQSLSTIIDVTICDGQTYFAGGDFQTVSGTYYDTLAASSGCDSIIVTNLTVLSNAVSTTVDAVICEGDSLFAGGAFQTEIGTYIDTFTTSEGCDSIVTTNLSVLENVASTVDVSICDGESYFAGGAFQTVSGAYFDTLTASGGCDSIVTTNLTVLPNAASTVDVSICDGDSYFAGGAFQTVSGTYFDTLAAANACDSIVSTNLTVLPNVASSVDVSICDGQSYFAGGADQITSGTYFDTLVAANGCDSVVVTQLTVLPNASVTLDPVICNGSSYFAGGALQTVSGTYFDTLVGANGCDSIVITNLIVLGTATITTNNDTAICAGASVQLNATGGLFTYTWTPPDGLSNPNIANPVATPTQTITYVVTTQAASGELIVNGDFSSGLTGFTSDYTASTDLHPEGAYYVGSNPGAYHSNFSACTDHTTGSGNMMIVNGAGIPGLNVWCQTINVLPNTDYAFSCWVSSVVAGSPAVLQFSINGGLLGSAFTAPSSICSWQQFYATWNSGSNTTANICIVNQNTSFSGNDFALDDISFTGTCIASDSVTITVLPPVTSTVDVSICDGESYFAGGAFQTTAGTYFDTVAAANGCDSIVTTTLTILPHALTTVNVSICNGDSYFVGGGDQTTAGTYFDTLVAANGCDSIVTTELVVLPDALSNVSVSICNGDSYFVGGADQTTAGTYFDTLVAANGCDSIVTTELIVLPDTITNVSAAICNGDSFFVGGDFQTAKGLYYDTLVAANGCDSIVVTDLDVLPNSFITLFIDICDGESFFVGGGDQTAAGIYNDTLVAANGCDSIVETTLTILPRSFTNVTVDICDGESHFAGGADQTASGTYFDTLIAANGCDSIVTTNLVVHPNVSITIDTTVCDGSGYFAGGAIQTTSGTYFDTLATAYGCDSVVITNLSFSTSMSFSFNITNASCNGLCDGAAECIVTGGEEPLAFIWSNGNTSAFNTNLCAATYGVTATDANGCTADAFATVGEPALLLASISQSNISCACANTVTQQGICVIDFAGLPAGTILNEQYAQFGIHISGDVLNSTALDQLIVFNTNATGTPDPDLQVNVGNIAILPQNLTDQNGDGLVDVPNDNNMGGFQTYIFDTPRDIISIKVVDKESPPGKATAYDANGNVIQVVTIPVGGNGSVQTIAINAVGVSKLVIDNRYDSGGITEITLGCTTQCCDGEATVNADGGTTPYTYAWSNGSTQQTAENLCAGDYEVTVTDANGCQTTTSVSIQEFDELEVTVSHQDVSSDCSPANQLCELDFGALPAGTILNEQYAQFGIHISGDAYGAFPDQVIVFDADASGTPDPDLEAGTGHLAIFPERLNDNNANGLVDVPNDQGQGGKMIFTFDQPKEVISFVFVDKEDGVGTAKAYDANNNLIKTVNILNLGNGSVQTVAVNATGVSKLVVDYRDSGGVTELLLGCDNSCCDGSASAAVTGGSAPYTYAWSNGETTATISNLCTGTYTVTVTDAEGCSGTQTVTIGDCGLAITGMILVHEGVSQDIAPLTEGAVISLDTLCPFNIRAVLCGAAGSVKFKINGVWFRVEAFEPYALAGDNPTGNYHPWFPAPGNYTVEATPYSGPNASGTAGNTFTIHFTVVGQQCSAQKMQQENSGMPSFEVSTYPNPFNEHLVVAIRSKESGRGWIILRDVLGKEVMSQQIAIEEGENKYDMQVKRSIASGAYFLEVRKGDGSERAVKAILKAE